MSNMENGKKQYISFHFSRTSLTVITYKTFSNKYICLTETDSRGKEIQFKNDLKKWEKILCLEEKRK